MVTLLPALPPAFAEGSVSGLRARGGLEVGLRWKGGKLERATLRASAAVPVTVLYAGHQTTVRLRAGQTYSLGPDLKNMTN